MFDGRDKDNASEGYPYHEDGFITADDADSIYKFVNRASEEKYQVSRRFGNREPLSMPRFPLTVVCGRAKMHIKTRMAL